MKSATALIGTSKQHANRLLEPFAWVTCIVSATEWDSFFELRCAADAQPEIAEIARMMRAQRSLSIPDRLLPGDWHLPLVSPEERKEYASDDDAAYISAGRCARVSWLTHYRDEDPQQSIDRASRLQENKHWSPFEHPARCEKKRSRYANYVGFNSLRSILQHGS